MSSSGENDFDQFWRVDGKNCLAFLDSLSTDIKSGDHDEASTAPTSRNDSKVTNPSPNQSNKIFIVHGHDIQLKAEVALFLQTLGLEPIILHMQANGGKTITEKLDKYTDVRFGIVLYTPDDVGASLSEAETYVYESRARQNVVFEHGYLIGKLGRERVVPLVKNIAEMPGDMSGIVYVSDNRWKHDIAKEMQHAGYIMTA